MLPRQRGRRHGCGWPRGRQQRRDRAGLGPGIRRRWPTLDVLCDPEMPPIPPHATCEQIRALSSALARDDPEAWHLMYQGAKTKAQVFLPHRG
jgi:hypothetical protein